MRLELDAGAHGAVVLDSGSVARPEGPGDTIDITVREDGSRDPNHVFSIRIVSAPAPVDPVPYELLAGSKVIVDCWVCELVAPERPIVGTFLLDKVSSDPDPVARYRIWDFAFQSDDGVYKGVADGIYTQGGQVAVVQTIQLEARWDDDVLTTGLAGGPGSGRRDLPRHRHPGDAGRQGSPARAPSSSRGCGSSPGPRKGPPRTGGAIPTPTPRSTSRTAFTSSSGASREAIRPRVWMRPTRTTTRRTTSPTRSTSSTSSSSAARRRPFRARARADRLRPRAAAAPRIPPADFIPPPAPPPGPWRPDFRTTLASGERSLRSRRVPSGAEATGDAPVTCR